MLKHVSICKISKFLLQKLLSSAFYLSLLLSFPYRAVSFTNPGDDIYIDSDILTINRQENSATFEGEVILWFEDMLLKTSKLQVIYKEGQDKSTTIDRIIIPRKVKATKPSDQEVIIADSAEYNVEKAELILLGDVVLQRGEHILRTKRLVYHGNLRSIERE